MLNEYANDIADRNLDSHRARFPQGTALTVPKTADSESENVVSTLKLTALSAGNGLDRSANAIHPLKQRKQSFPKVYRIIIAESAESRPTRAVPPKD